MTKNPEPIIESIFETEKRQKRKAIIVLKEAKKAEDEKIKNGFHWVALDSKTMVLRKLKND